MRLLVADIPLKHFLKLLKPKESIKVIELGDTMHPSNGFVNETILGEVRQVYQINEQEYDFKGLIYFEAIIKAITLKYHNQLYEVSGEPQKIEKIVSKLRMLNAQSACIPKFNIKLIEE